MGFSQALVSKVIDENGMRIFKSPFVDNGVLLSFGFNDSFLTDKHVGEDCAESLILETLLTYSVSNFLLLIFLGQFHFFDYSFEFPLLSLSWIPTSYEMSYDGKAYFAKNNFI